MKFPRANSHFSIRVRFGTYLARRLRREHLTALAADIEKSTASLTTLGRANEDAQRPVQEAMADRDAADDALDVPTQTFRGQVAGRSVDAIRTAPYTRIFPDGVAYYIAAPLDEEVARYNELKQRVEEHLPADDAARITLVTAIDSGLSAFTTATAALSAARTAGSLASTRLTAATEAWTKQIEKVYGLLVAEHGKKGADTFFPRPTSRGKDDGDVQASEDGAGGGT